MAGLLEGRRRLWGRAPPTALARRANGLAERARAGGPEGGGQLSAGEAVRCDECLGKLPKLGASRVKVDHLLCIQPKLGRRAERCCKLQRNLGRDSRSTVHDTVDDLHILTDVIRKLLLAHLELPPVLEALGLAEVEHNPKNNRMRAE